MWTDDSWMVRHSKAILFVLSLPGLVKKDGIRGGDSALSPPGRRTSMGSGSRRVIFHDRADLSQEVPPTMVDERPEIVWLTEPAASLSVGEIMGANARVAVGLGLARVHPILGVFWGIAVALAWVKTYKTSRQRNLSRREKWCLFFGSLGPAMVVLPVASMVLALSLILILTLFDVLVHAMQPVSEAEGGTGYGVLPGLVFGTSVVSMIAVRFLIRRYWKV